MNNLYGSFLKALYTMTLGQQAEFGDCLERLKLIEESESMVVVYRIPVTVTDQYKIYKHR